MRPQFPHLDIHSHDLSRADRAVVNLSPDDEIPSGVYCSVGVHPWDADKATEVTFARIEAMAQSDRVVAIGETGLDALKGPSIEVQQTVFERHVAVSEQTGKPLIIHAVKTVSQIIALRRRLKPSQPWIIHGFRGKPQQAAELLQHGFYISLGERFNAQTAAMIPVDRLFFETDESELPIELIVENINTHRNATN